MNTNFDKLTAALDTVEFGRDTDLKVIYRYAAGLRQERGAMAEASRQTGRTQSTIKAWAIQADAWAVAAAREGQDVTPQELRKGYGAAIKAKASVKDIEAILDGGEWTTLSEFLALITPAPVEPVEEDTQEESEETLEEPQEEAEETLEEPQEEAKGALVDVVLSALPHLSTDDLARVWDALAELAAVRDLELV